MKARHAAPLAAAAALLALPSGLTDFWIFITVEVLAFALYAVSFNVLLGYGGMLSFGHAAFFGVGGYTAALVVKQSGLPPALAFACLPLAAMFVSAAAALVIGFFSVRRAGIYFAMLTFAFQMLLYTIALKATPLTGGDDGLTGLKAAGTARTAARLLLLRSRDDGRQPVRSAPRRQLAVRLHAARPARERPARRSTSA